MNTAAVSLAVTPTVVSTLLSHYLNRKPLRQRPTAHLSYDEGLHLIRSFLTHASHHTVEELQAFTAQWVPHPQWVRVKEVEVPEDQLAHSAALLEQQLGPDGIRRVGGRKWWQWRKPQSPLKAEWIEMKSDYQERKKSGDAGRRVMLYVHGGAYFFGSVDEHRYQLQRHARKLKARVFAPRYRLAPQFPFPCGLQDCLAAYLHLLTVQEPNTIVLAGDSAGGGMVMSMLVTLRDQGLPLPAGAILVSPWVDLTHSFPSVAGESRFDYIPQSGFHHKPSAAWPPPSQEQLEELKKLSAKAETASKDGETVADDLADGETTAHVKLTVKDKEVAVEEQIQMYTTNELLSHPLVSPIMQPTLGGLPPLLIMAGGGEILRDEQIYLAHKCANPSKYLPRGTLLDDKARAAIQRFKPTDVQLQVWDDLCHVAPTLSFTRPAKYMYRSIAQFGAWALARAQKREIDILDDDDISIISSSDSDSDGREADTAETKSEDAEGQARIGKAGDPLPPFKAHMIRQKVTRHGVVFSLAPAAELPGCCMDPEHIGVPKEGPVGKWLECRKHWETRYDGLGKRVHKKRIKDLGVGLESFGKGEFPPPSALAGRRKVGADLSDKKKKRSYGLSLWSLWGSKHDEMTVTREQQADKEPEIRPATADEGQGARSFAEIERQGPAPRPRGASRSGSRRRFVKDEMQVGEDSPDENTTAAEIQALMEQRAGGGTTSRTGLLSPNYQPDTGVTGKRAFLDGIAMPFSIKKEADTASMLTLNSAMYPSRVATPRPMSSVTMTSLDERKADGASRMSDSRPVSMVVRTPGTDLETPGFETFVTPAMDFDRPPLDTFVTATEGLPQVKPNTDQEKTTDV